MVKPIAADVKIKLPIDQLAKYGQIQFIQEILGLKAE